LVIYLRLQRTTVSQAPLAGLANLFFFSIIC